MALPDIDTANVSWIAFWNHLDNGASSIDPAEAASYLDTYQEYTNGIEGSTGHSFSAHNNRTVWIRVKDDGWIVAWIDETEGEQVYTNNPPIGAHDLIEGWDDQYDDRPVGENILALEIESIRNELSNTGASTFNYSDVGLYNYLAPNATTITHMQSENASDITPSSTTTLHFGWATAIGWNDLGQAYLNPPDDSQFQLCDLYDNARYGVRNVIHNADLQAGETTTLDHEHGRSRTDVVVCWS